MGQSGAVEVIADHRGDLPRPHDLQTWGEREAADRSKSCRRPSTFVMTFSFQTKAERTGINQPSTPSHLLASDIF